MASDKVPRPMSKRALVRSWHTEASFWREVYARTLSALLAAGVVLIVAWVAGALAVDWRRAVRGAAFVALLLVVPASDVLIDRARERGRNPWFVTVGALGVMAVAFVALFAV